MKSLSLSRPLVILMLGAPGAGKSFFARQFTETFNTPIISLDKIRSSIYSKPTFTKDQEAAVQAVASQVIIELLKTQKTFIVDGGVNARTDRLAIGRQAREQGYGTLIIWVQTDEPTSRTRATRRNPKRSGDAYNTSLSDVQYETIAKKLMPPTPSEPFVVISGKHTFATQAKVVLKKLVVPRERSAAAHSYSEAGFGPEPTDDTPQRRNITIT